MYIQMNGCDDFIERERGGRQGGRESNDMMLRIVVYICEWESEREREGGRQGGGGYLWSLRYAVWREGDREEEVICGLSDMPCGGKETGRRGLSVVSQICHVEGGRQGGGGYLWSLRYAVWREGDREEEVICGLSDMPCGGREAGWRRLSVVSRICRVYVLFVSPRNDSSERFSGRGRRRGWH